MYKLVKENLQKSGEVMIKTSDGDKFELHLHNTRFDDENEVVIIDAATQTYWISGKEIVYMWIHKVKD